MWKWHIHVLKTRFPTAQAPAPGGGRRLRRGAAVPGGGVGPLLGRTRRRRLGRCESRDRHGRRGAAARHYGGVALRRLAFRRPAGRVCIVRGERELPHCCAVVAGGVVGRVCRTRGCRQRTGARGLACVPTLGGRHLARRPRPPRRAAADDYRHGHGRPAPRRGFGHGPLDPGRRLPRRAPPRGLGVPLFHPQAVPREARRGARQVGRVLRVGVIDVCLYVRSASGPRWSSIVVCIILTGISC